MMTQGYRVMDDLQLRHHLPTHSRAIADSKRKREKLDKELKKQEEDYLKGYTIYVKQKEKELQELIVNLNERNKNTTLKDTIIINLKKNISKLNEDMILEHKEKD